MGRKPLALLMLVVSIGMGCLGAGLFLHNSFGIKIPIYMIVTTFVILGTAYLSQQTINYRNLWVIAPMLFFAIMVAVRASGFLLIINVCAMLALGTLYIRYLTSDKALDTAPLTSHMLTPIDVGLHSTYAPLMEVGHSIGLIRNRDWQNVNHLGAVVRGCLLTIPILLVFVVLLGSADIVFANTFDGLLGWVSSVDMTDLVMPALIGGITGWLMLTALSYALARPTATPSQTSAEHDDTAQAPPTPFKIGIIESGMILGSVTLLFAFFVAIQFTYLFGGQANIADNLNYSQYARRGFFELIAVALLVLGMILTLDHITTRRKNHQVLLFRVLSITIIALTMVMLVSAWRRMELYELTYGFTYLRVLPHVFMFWLAVLLIFVVLHVLRLQTNIFALGLLLSSIGYVATLNIMNLDHYIASRNIQAYFDDPQETDFDICYLRTLSIDAIVPMIDLYQRVEGDDPQNLREHIVWWINDKMTSQQQYYDGSLLNWHFAYATTQSMMANNNIDLLTLDQIYTPIRNACYSRLPF